MSTRLIAATHNHLRSALSSLSLTQEQVSKKEHFEGIALLDGGFGTTLEDVFGRDISGALWSASLVDKDPEIVIDTHLSFLNAGSDIILTSTYQCAFETFDRAGYSRLAAVEVMRKSIHLAAQARERFQNGTDTHRQIRIVLSLGPFGATLSPAQEFDGIYPPPYGPKAFTSDGANTTAFSDSEAEGKAVKHLEEFHYERLTVFSGNGENSIWSLIDGIAFETVPLAREVLAIRRAMRRLKTRLLTEGLVTKPWWISTVWPSGVHPQERAPGGARLDAGEVVRALLSKSLDVSQLDANSNELSVPDGIGVNCTHIEDVDAVVSKLRIAVESMRLGKKLALVLYPNGGTVYDIVNHTWMKTEDAGEEYGAKRSCHDWSEQLSLITKREQASGIWQALVVGGCCKTGPSHIKLLQSALSYTRE